MPNPEPELLAAKRQRTLGSPQPSRSRDIATLDYLPDGELRHKMAASALGRPLKGRRRFLADLEDAVAACEVGVEVQGLTVLGESCLCGALSIRCL